MSNLVNMLSSGGFNSIVKNLLDAACEEHISYFYTTKRLGYNYGALMFI